MSGIALTLAGVALPYAASGAAKWVNAAVKTYAPGFIASMTTNGAAATGSQMLGGVGVAGRIGSAVGRVFGWAAAPLVAQSNPVQNNIFAAGNLMGSATGALVAVGGSYLLNRATGKNGDEKKEELPAIQQLLIAQQMQAKQLHEEWEAQMKAQQGASQIEVKQMLEFTQLVQAKKGHLDLKDLEEFLKQQKGKIDIGQLLQIIQLVQTMPAPNLGAAPAA